MTIGEFVEYEVEREGTLDRGAVGVIHTALEDMYGDGDGGGAGSAHSELRDKDGDGGGAGSDHSELWDRNSSLRDMAGR